MSDGEDNTFVTLADLSRNQAAMQLQLRQVLELLRTQQEAINGLVTQNNSSRLYGTSEAPHSAMSLNTIRPASVAGYDHARSRDTPAPRAAQTSQPSPGNPPPVHDRSLPTERPGSTPSHLSKRSRGSVQQDRDKANPDTRTPPRSPRKGPYRDLTLSSLPSFIMTPRQRQAVRHRAAARFEERRRLRRNESEQSMFSNAETHPVQNPLSRCQSSPSLADKDRSELNAKEAVSELSPRSSHTLGERGSTWYSEPETPDTVKPRQFRPQVGFARVDSVPVLHASPGGHGAAQNGQCLAPWSLHRRRSNIMSDGETSSVREAKAEAAEAGESSRQRSDLSSIVEPTEHVCTLRSNNPLKRALDVVVLMFVAVELVYASYHFAVRKMHPTETYTVTMFVFLPVFVCWIALNFRTCVLDGWHLIESKEMITRYYMKSWFMYDVAVTFPWDLVLYNVHTTAFRVALLVRMGKLLMIHRVLLPGSPVSERPVWVRVLLNVSSLVVIGHFAAVSWIYVSPREEWSYWLSEIPALTPESAGEDTTITRYYWEQYCASLYWAVATVTSVGYGDIAARSTGGRLLSLLWMPVGTTLLLLAGAKLTEWMVVTDPFVLAEQDKKRKLAALMDNNNIPWSVQKSALEVYPVVLETSSHVYNTIIDELPRFLQDEIRLHVKLKLIRNVSLFDNLSAACLEAVADVTVEEVYELDSAITEYGDPGSDMFFLEHGLVEVFTYNREGDEVWLANLKNGSFFGEMALLNDDCRRSATVRTVTQCVVYALSKQGFTAVTNVFPELKQRVVEESATRMQSMKCLTSTDQQTLILDDSPRSQTSCKTENMLLSVSVTDKSHMQAPTSSVLQQPSARSTSQMSSLQPSIVNQQPSAVGTAASVCESRRNSQMEEVQSVFSGQDERNMSISK